MHQVAYQAHHRDGILQLLGNMPYKAAIWHWQFEENPFDRPFRPVLLLDDQDKVLGFNGVMPVVISEHGKPVDVLWSCDFYVAQECRGQGVGKHIKEILMQQSETMITFGVSDQAAHVLSRMGWIQSRDVYNYRLLRRADSLRNGALLILQCLNRIRGLGKLRDGDYTLCVRNTLPARQAVDELWERTKGGFHRLVARTYAYLDWKYQRHPLARYAFISAWRENRLEGLLVVRFHRGVLRIVDYAGPAHDAQLKRLLIRKCRKQWRHAHQMMTTTSDPELGDCLQSEGFFRARTRPRFFVYSRHIDTEGYEKGWFIMAGDSDGELLQAAADQYDTPTQH